MSQTSVQYVQRCMTNLIHKGVRLPTDLIQRVNRVAKQEGSTFSQFVRTAIIRELNMVERRKA